MFMNTEVPINSIHVIKFGGVLMGSAENIRHSAEYIAQQPAETGILAVVSAANGETNHLVDLSQDTASGDHSIAKEKARSFSMRQQELVTNLNLPPSEEAKLLLDIYASYEQIMLHIGLERFYPFMTDLILSQGERLSSTIFTSALKSTGTDTVKIDAHHVIKTDSNFGNATPNVTSTTTRIEQRIKPQILKGRRVVMPGFYGSNSANDTTTMPRNSSDLSAALGAFGLNADTLFLAKGIPGVYDKNPHLHSDAAHLNWLSYESATEISNNGGKIIYPDVMNLMKAKDIPIVVFDPRNPTQQSTISSMHPKN